MPDSINTTTGDQVQPTQTTDPQQQTVPVSQTQAFPQDAAAQQPQAPVQPQPQAYPPQSANIDEVMKLVNLSKAEDRKSYNEKIASLESKLSAAEKQLKEVQEPDYSTIKDEKIRTELQSLQQQLTAEKTAREDLEKRNELEAYKSHIRSLLRPGEAVEAMIGGGSIEEINRSVAMAKAEADRLRSMFAPAVQQQQMPQPQVQQQYFPPQPQQNIPSVSQQAQAMPQPSVGPTAPSPQPPVLDVGQDSNLLAQSQQLTGDQARRTGSYMQSREQLLNTIQQMTGGGMPSFKLEPTNSFGQHPVSATNVQSLSWPQPGQQAGYAPPGHQSPQARQRAGVYTPPQAPAQPPSPHQSYQQGGFQQPQIGQPTPVQQAHNMQGGMPDFQQGGIAPADAGTSSTLQNPTGHPMFRNS